MTDKEIIEALRCCADHSCSDKCPAFPAGLDCREKMHKYIFVSEFGKTVFLTREEAERAIQEMEGKKDG